MKIKQIANYEEFSKLYLEGHSYLEISKIEKVSINCAWKSVDNGLEKLRESLHQYR